VSNVKFTASYTGIGEMLCAPFMVADMAIRAEKGMALGQLIAPVYHGRGGDPHRGRYRASFVMEAGVRQRKTRRAYGRVSNLAPEAFYVEYGTRNNEAHHVMLKVLDAMSGHSSVIRGGDRLKGAEKDVERQRDALRARLEKRTVRKDPWLDTKSWLPDPNRHRSPDEETPPF
jgi:hypothetical protein